MALFPAPNAKRERIDLTEGQLKAFVRNIDTSKINNIVTVLDGGGLDLIKNRVTTRFAEYLVTDEEGGKLPEDAPETMEERGGWYRKRDAAKAEAIRLGMHTISSSFGFKRINFQRATLFDAGSIFLYSEKNPSFREDLADARNAARHDRRMARLDLLGCGIGSAGCRVSADVRGFDYETFDPGKIWVVHNEEILLHVDGQGQPQTARANKLNIEDANIVVLELARGANTTGSKSKFIAYFGRSEKLPFGRMVEYESEDWNDIPDPGGGGMDYTLDGEILKYPDFERIANPLTVYQDETKNQSPVEYPIISWQMDKTADGTAVFPISGTMLFDVLHDLDVEWSRDIESSGRSARGAFFLEDPNNQGTPLDFSEGSNILKRGQKPSLLSHGAGNAKEAIGSLLISLEQVAGAYNVPGYKVATKESFQAASGFALRILNQPLTQDRIARTTVNTDEMSRKFWIERALANMTEKGKEKIPLSINEKWQPKEIEQIETVEEEIARQQHELETNMISIIDTVQKANDLDSREAAIKLMEQNKADNEQFKTKPAAPGPGGGLLQSNRRQPTQ